MNKTIWVLGTIAFTLLLIGLTIMGFYLSVDTISVQPTPLVVGESGSTQDISLWNYNWNQPVCGGLVYKPFKSADGPKMEPKISIDGFKLPLGHSSMMGMKIRIKNEAGLVFEGTEAQYKDFSLPQNGEYSFEVNVGREKVGGKPYGWFFYKFKVNVKVKPEISVLNQNVSQGDIVAVLVKGTEPGVRPIGESELGPVNFVKQNNEFISFVPVAYNREIGDYDILITCDDYTETVSVNVAKMEYQTEKHYTREYLKKQEEELLAKDEQADEENDENPSASPSPSPSPSPQASPSASASPQAEEQTEPAEPEKTEEEILAEEMAQSLLELEARDNAAAAKEYRDKIWPLFEVWDDGIAWEQPFMQPVSMPITSQFGAMVYLDDGKEVSRNSGIDIAAEKGMMVVSPNVGRVLFAGNLKLTGKTVVIEHGGGIKSFYYHLDTLEVKEGDTVVRATPIGTVGETGTDEPPHLSFEVKIGNQSIDPVALFRGISVIYQVMK